MERQYGSRPKRALSTNKWSEKARNRLMETRLHLQQGVCEAQGTEERKISNTAVNKLYFPEDVHF